MVPIFSTDRVTDLNDVGRAKVSAILSHGGRLLVGLSIGILRIYQLRGADDNAESSDDARRPITPSNHSPVHGSEDTPQFMHFRVSKRAVEQIGVIKEADVLVILSDGSVGLHNLQTGSLVRRLKAVQGASSLSFNTESREDNESGVRIIVSRLAALIKRRVIVYTWRDGVCDESEEPREFTFPSSVRSLLWQDGGSAICGLNSGFVYLDGVTGDTHDIVRTTGQPASTAAGAGAQSFGSQGAAMSYVGISGWTPPTMATKLYEDQVLLARDVASHFVDKHGHDLGRRAIPWISAPDEIAYSHPYLLSIFRARNEVEVRNPETLAVLQTIRLTSLRVLHIPSSSLSLAHAAKDCYIAGDDAIWRLTAGSYSEQIQSLCDAQMWVEALSILSLLEDALVLDKETLTRTIRTRRADSLFAHHEYRKALELYTEAHAPVRHVIGLFPEEIAGPSVAARGNAMLSQLGYKNAVIELCSFLVQSRTRLQTSSTSRIANSDSLSVPQSTSVAPSHDTPHSTTSNVAPPLDEPLETDSKLRHELGVLIDTTLFRAWMLARPSMATVLFRQTNLCDPEVVTEKLTESERFKELIEFYEGKKLHTSALKLLHELGSRDPEASSSPEFCGPQKTIDYLSRLSPADFELVFEFSTWPLLHSPDMGLRLFTDNSQLARAFPRSRVISFLQDISQDLERRYLAYLIFELQDSTSIYHDRYLRLMILSQPPSGVSAPADSNAWEARLFQFLDNGRYSLRKALSLLSSDSHLMQEARAIVLGRMHQHREALQLYALVLRNFEKAEKYANKAQEQLQRESSQEGSASTAAYFPPSPIHQVLLELYLSPPTPYEPDVGSALKLLSRNASQIPLDQVAESFQRAMPMRLLGAYLTGLVRSTESCGADLQIFKSFMKTISNRVEARLRLGDDPASTSPRLQYRGLKVCIEENRACEICHKWLSRSVISVLADERVVHYGCSRLEKP